MERGRAAGGASPSPRPLWERIQNRGIGAAKSQILLVRGSHPALMSRHTKTPRANTSLHAAWGIFWSANEPVGRGRKARGGWWNGWLGAFTRAPPVRDTGAFRAQMGLLPGDWSTQSRAVRFVRLNRQPNPPLPDLLPASIPSSETGLVRTGVLRRRRCWCGPAVSGSGVTAGVFLSPSFRPAGAAPANQNSPPSASQNSVGPGHPIGAKGGASVTRGERVGKKMAGFFGPEIVRMQHWLACPGLSNRLSRRSDGAGVTPLRPWRVSRFARNGVPVCGHRVARAGSPHCADWP